MGLKVIDPITLTPKVVNATTYDVALADFGLTLVDDDYIVLYVHTHATTGSLSISGAGWSELVELDVTSGGQMAVYIAKVASGAVADPTITASVTTTWQIVLEQWRDVDVTTGTITTDFAEVPTPTQANATTVTSATFTPAANDGTIVYFGAARGGTGQHCRFLSDKVVASANPQIDIGSSSFAMAIGTVQQATAAATAETMYAVESARLGCITFAVKNKSGGKLERDCRAAMTKVGWFGNYGNVHEGVGSLTYNAPSTFCVWNAGTEQMAGIDLATTALTPTHNTVGLPPINGRWSDMNSNANTAGQWVGIWWATPTTLDMTGKIFSLEWFMAQLGDSVGEKGVAIAFGDDAAADTGNAVVFQLAPKLQIPLNTLQTSHIAVENATQLAAVGSIDWSLIKKMGLFYHRAGSNTNYRSVSWRNMFLHGVSALTGGNPTRPLNGQFLDNALNGWSYTGLCTKSGDAMLAKTSFSFGDGSKPTYVDTTATLINTPEKYSVNSQSRWNVPANAITIGVNGASGDTYNFTASALAAGSGAEQNFTVTAAAGATVSTQGGVFGNLLWTGSTDFDPVGATYSGCDTVAWVGALVDNCSVSRTTSTNAAASITANTTISNTPIDGTGAAYALELGTSVTAATLASCTLTAGSTNKVHVLKTTGTVTITISGTTTLASGDVTSEGATVDIAAPELYQKVTVSGITTGARVQIYDTTSSTELFNGTASAGNTVISGSTVVWTDPAAASADRAIRVRVSYVSGATAKNFIETSGLTCGQTSGTAEITYPVTPTDDTVYNANGENGATIYGGGEITFVDASPDRIEMAMVANTLSLKEQYAAWVYYVFTSAGIATDIDYINAIDTANYEFTGIRWKNVSSPTAPLKVTGGYAWDSVTLDPMTLIDTSGGTIFMAPAHVVAYQTTGTYAITGDLQDALDAIAGVPADVLSAAQTTPIHADVRKVNSYTVDGDGQTGTEWGPA